MRYQKALTLVEVVVGAAIISGFLLAALTTFQTALVLNGRNVRLIQATFLAEEGVEALKLLRDSGYHSKIGSLAKETTHFLVFENGQWQATSTNVYVDGYFERSFVLTNVYRDGSSQDVVTSGGSIDASTTKAVVTVAWREKNATTSKAISTYITNLFGN